MNRTRNVISAEIERYIKVLERLQSELADLPNKETTLLGRIGDELLSGSNQASKDLIELQISRDIKLRELEIAGSKLSGLRSELSDLDLAESTQPWTTFEAGLPARIVKIRTQLNGLRSEMDTMKQELDGLSSAAERTGQDAAIKYSRLKNIFMAGTKELSQLQKLLNDF